jgi:flagellar hook protein FlgE
MSSVFGIALSGLAVDSLRLAVSANNVANGLSAGFMPSRVAAREQAGGGVEASVVQENDPEVEARIDRAIAGLSSGTDLAEEAVNQILAAASFRANLASLRSANEMLGALVDLKR